MTDKIFLSRDKYTIQNALMWGMCDEHLKQATKSKSTFYWLGNLACAAALVLPGPGQLVGLVGCAVAKIFKLANENETTPPEKIDPARCSTTPKQTEQIDRVDEQASRVLPTAETSIPAFQEDIKTLTRQIARPVLENLILEGLTETCPLQLLQELLEDQESYEASDILSGAEVQSSASSTLNAQLMQWPANLSTIGLIEAEKDLMDTHFTALLNALNNKEECSYTPNTITYRVGDALQTFELPLPFFVTESDDPEDPTEIELCFGENLQFTYNLMTTECLETRYPTGYFEGMVLEHLGKRREKIVDLEVIVTKEKGVIESVESIKSEGTLFQLFDQIAAFPFIEKLNLLLGFHEDHIRMKSSVVSKSLFEAINSFLMPTSSFHGNLSLNALSLYKVGQQLHLLISDLETFSNPFSDKVSIGYTCPTFASKLDSANRINEIEKYYSVYASQKDLWAKGMIFLTVLVGRQEKIKTANGDIFIPPLECLKKCIVADSTTLNAEAYLYNYLKQSELDKELEGHKISVLEQTDPKDHGLVESVFKMIKSALRINPNDRTFNL